VRGKKKLGGTYSKKILVYYYIPTAEAVQYKWNYEQRKAAMIKLHYCHD
jgi:hypothetical protein